LDKRFGKEYVVFLSADHGAANNPSFMMDNKMLGGFIESNRIKEEFDKRIEEELGPGEWVRSFSENIYLNRALINEKKLDLNNVQDKVKRIVLEFPEVFEAYAGYDLEKRNGSNRTEILLENGFNTKMSGDLMVRFKPGYISGYQNGGTTHGSGFNYDTHVPILFYGQGIPSGESVRKVSITDIAPTLSMLLNVSLPNAATGVPLSELFE
jgi:arylsulfatase A-like enzyme